MSARALPRSAVRLVLGLGLTGAAAVLAVNLLTNLDQSPIGWYFELVAVASAVVMVVLGTRILSSQPGNVIGWLLVALAGWFELWSLSQNYAEYALYTRPGSLPFATFAAWVAHWSLIPLLTVFVPIFLLFPDGHLPSPRWRWVMWVWALASAASLFGFATSPKPIDVGAAEYGRGPVAAPFALGQWVDTLATIAGPVAFTTAIAACVAIVVRFRRARGDERQQIRWLASVGVAFFTFLGTALLLDAVVGEENMQGLVGDLVFATFFTVLVVGLPLALGIAILKYRLYDLDVVIRKTVIVGAMAVFIAVVYGAIVGGIGALVGTQGGPALSFLGAAVLAIAFQPARERARRLADRVVYGKRATPYEVLTEFSERVGETYASEDVLARMAMVLGEGTGAESASVWLRIGDAYRAEATWPKDAHAPAALPGDAVEVSHQGELLGALSAQMPPSDPMNPGREKLIGDLAAQAGLVLRNVKLIEELRASRQRLVAAQDEERRRLERNLHDGAQQQLVALSVQLKLARSLVDRDPANAGAMLETVQGAAADALEDLRDLARGIYPPLLADQGLPAALEAQARKAAVPTSVDAEGIGRYGQEIEAAVYFSTLEALNNVAKYAEASRAAILLQQQDGHLTVSVSDDGRGFDVGTTSYGTGLQGMADRLDAIGGTLEVRSSPGAGTTVVGRIPVEATA